MENKKYLSEEEYQQTEKKLLKLSKTFLIVGVCLSLGVILLGLIITSQNEPIVVEEVDYVAETKAQIEDLKVQLNEEQKKLDVESEKLIIKKNELIEKGIEESKDYNAGEAYDLYILDNALDPGDNYCHDNEFKKNELSKEYCLLKNNVEDIEKQIESKEEYISSGRAEDTTIAENERLKQKAEWDASSDKRSFLPFLILAIPCFMFPGIIAMMLFTTAKRRSIMAFSTQQVMPVAKEGIEEMAPTAGVAAKEIAKGIKEGLEDEDE